MRPSYRPFRALALLSTFALAAALTYPAMAQTTPDSFTVQALTPDETITGSAKSSEPSSIDQETGTAPATGRDGMVSVFVKLRPDSLASYEGGVPGLAPTNPKVTGDAELDVNAPESQQYLQYLDGELDAFETIAVDKLSGATITYRFDVIMGGVSMVLPANQLGALAQLPGVEAIYSDGIAYIDTDRSLSFIGANVFFPKLGGASSAGEGVVFGSLDSGLWPEHPSFADPDPSGKPYAAPPPPRDNPGRVRACQYGSAIPGDAQFACNNKLIGAYRFMATYEAIGNPQPNEFRSARDDDGHGSHTASTAAGNAGVSASIFGVERGVISGVAPRAHVIGYKVCSGFTNGCYNVDSAAAAQQAIRDGVDVINFSVGGGTNPYSDLVSLAFLDAYNAGVTVAASAGNSGPGAETTGHREPWTITVGASTTDRAFKNTVTLFGNGGATLSARGTSVTAGLATQTPIVLPPDATCDGTYVPGQFAGKVVVCERGGVRGRIAKGFAVQQAGGVGMVLYNQAANVTDQQTDNHYLPTSQVQFADGQAIKAFIAANPGATATLTAGETDTQQGDVMASFSSRGGPQQTLGISKPDITAPGVQILAAHSPLTADPTAGPQGELFQSIAGTSMSSPHVAGAAVLMKDLYPEFTPGQIRSALMTTASTARLYKEDGVTPFTPFDAGTGRLNLRKAWNPGLTFSDTGANYVALQNELWKANYPSVYIPTMPGIVTVQRTARDVTGEEGEYEITVVYPSGQPKDFKIKVPDELEVEANGEETFDITIDAKDVPLGQVRHATIVLNSEDDDDGEEIAVRLPVTFVRKQPSVTLSKSCDPANFKRFTTTTCTLSITNTTFDPASVSLIDKLPSQLKLVGGSVTGGGTGEGNTVRFQGTIAPVEPPNVTAALGTSPFGYFPLGTAPVAGVGDETSTNFTLPPVVVGNTVYTSVGFVSNGYLVLGGTAGAADIQYINTNLPNAQRPNNVLAPFWTDLNPAFGGQMRAGILSAGANSWVVFDWRNVVNYSDREANSFQVWLPYNTNSGTVNGVSARQTFFAYGAVSDGDGSLLTIGAENEFGNRGQAVYFNGSGTIPAPNGGVQVNRAAGAPGETRTITFQVEGRVAGQYVNYAEMSSPSFFGTNVARFGGTISR